MLRVVAALILVAGLTGPADAQHLPDAVAEAYVAYTEAVEAGDYEAAARSARTAWRAAESGGVDAETTAILADNYAQLASALVEHAGAGDAYETAAGLLNQAGAAGELVADTWILAANAALNAGDHRGTIQRADTAGDLAESLDEIDPARRAGLVFFSRSLHANALWLDGRPRGAGMRAAEAMAAAEGHDLAPNPRYGLTAFILGAANALELDFDAAAFRFAEALEYMESERRGLSIWAQYARSRLDEDERLDLLARLDAAGLIDPGDEEDAGAPDEVDRPDGWIDAEPIRRRPPEYPFNVRQAGAEGLALIEFTIDERGRTRDIEVVISVPFSDFGAAAVEAVEDWRYTPASVNGDAVRRDGLITQFEYTMAD